MHTPPLTVYSMIAHSRMAADFVLFVWVNATQRTTNEQRTQSESMPGNRPVYMHRSRSFSPSLLFLPLSPYRPPLPLPLPPSLALRL